MRISRPAPVQGHQARKRFGQHFLADPRILSAIVACVDPRPGEYVVEIGPGLGALTASLLDRLGRLTAVEIDRDLAARLRRRYPAERLELIEGDALKVDWSAIGAASSGAPMRLVGNLPYNISSPLLVRLLECRDQVLDQHFMLQREVVQRIVSTGGAEYGRLGVLLQAFYDCESVLEVPPEAFDPPPRVDSAVVRMRTRARPAVAGPAVLSAMLSVAFGQRRKMLRKTLLPWLLERGIADSGIEGERRAEEIAPSIYHGLAARIESMREMPAG